MSRTVRTNLPEGIIAEPLGALQKRYEDLDIGSYPAFRNGKPSVSLVLRGTDDARLAPAAAELMDTIKEMNGEAEEFVPGRSDRLAGPASRSSAALSALLLWLHAPGGADARAAGRRHGARGQWRQGEVPAARPSSLAQGVVGCWSPRWCRCPSSATC